MLKTNPILSTSTKSVPLFQQMLGNSLLRNSLFIMFSTVLTSGLGYFYWIIIARTWSPVELGLVSALFSLLALVANLTNFGIGSTLIQILPTTRSASEWSATFNTALLVAGFAGIAGGGLLAFCLPLVMPQLINNGQQIYYTILCLAAIPLLNIALLLDSVYTAERACGNLLARNLAFSLFKLGLLVAIIPFGWTTPGISWVWLAALLLVVWIGFKLLKKLKPEYRLTVKITGVGFRQLVTPSFWNYFINLGAMLPTYLLPTLVALRLSAEENAFFYTTWMLAGLFFMISPAIATSLFAEGSNDTHSLRRKTLQSILYLVGALPLVIILFSLGSQFLLSIFGNLYAQKSQDLFYLLLFSTIPDAITTIYVGIMRARKLLYLAALLNLFTAVLTLCLSWWLLTPLGIKGAGVAWLVAQTLGCGLVFVHYFVRKVQTSKLAADSSDNLLAA